MDRDDQTEPALLRGEEFIHGWYTTFNDDGDFPNGYGDTDGPQVFVLGSAERDDAWIATPIGNEQDLEEWH